MGDQSRVPRRERWPESQPRAEASRPGGLRTVDGGPEAVAKQDADDAHVLALEAIEQLFLEQRARITAEMEAARAAAEEGDFKDHESISRRRTGGASVVGGRRPDDRPEAAARQTLPGEDGGADHGAPATLGQDGRAQQEALPEAHRRQALATAGTPFLVGYPFRVPKTSNYILVGFYPGHQWPAVLSTRRWSGAGRRCGALPARS